MKPLRRSAAALLCALFASLARAGDQAPYYGNQFALMTKMKSQGCTYDGITTASNPAAEAALVNRSQCVYLHRALETWVTPPDFEHARSVLSQVTKPGMIYGMFIAEAISRNSQYWYPGENRLFDFTAMCKSGTWGAWDPPGDTTCVPDTASLEYQKYLTYIVKRALDAGITVIEFGQVMLVDDYLNNPHLPGLIAQFRGLAAARGQRLIVGGQTDFIEDATYLSSFDFIFGGVGYSITDPPGYISDQETSTKMGWPLLWHPRWRSNANAVMINFDWFSDIDDDMNIFARHTPGDRLTALGSYYTTFLGMDVGFMIPFRTPLAGTGLGCHGENLWVYSPDNAYTCQDEGSINAAIGTRLPDPSGCTTRTQCKSNVCLDGYCGFKPNGWGCASDDQCASHYCPATGICTARKLDHQSCVSSRECASNTCHFGLCGLVPDGDHCVVDSDCDSYFCKYTAAHGWCTARLPDLSPCTSSRTCSSWVCLDGFCGYKPAGWECSTSAVCASHQCVGGACQ